MTSWSKERLKMTKVGNLFKSFYEISDWFSQNFLRNQKKKNHCRKKDLVKSVIERRWQIQIDFIPRNHWHPLSEVSYLNKDFWNTFEILNAVIVLETLVESKRCFKASYLNKVVWKITFWKTTVCKKRVFENCLNCSKIFS